jgi:AhpD family alkylhydroperoxidase
MSTTATSYEEPRMEIGRRAAAPPGARHANEVELDPRMRELVNLRASILNGCADCIDKHTKIARKAGESEQRLHAVAAWHEAPFFDDKERSALALTDAVTLISDEHVPREVLEEGECTLRAGRTPSARVGDHGDQRLEPDRHHDADAACGVGSDDHAQYQ